MLIRAHGWHFAGPVLLAAAAIGLFSPARGHEQPPIYIQSGEIGDGSARIWARCNREREARVVATVWSQRDAVKRFMDGPLVTTETDFTTVLPFDQLAADTSHDYQVVCIGDGFRDISARGSFKTAANASDPSAVKFVWVADLAGQGWGRNPELVVQDIHDRDLMGGYVIFDAIDRFGADFAILAGDIIYADNAIDPQQAIPEALGGGHFTNHPAKPFIAVTLEEYRRNWRYNLGDERFLAFLRKTPTYAQWDDHEVTNNWYPGEILAPSPYDGLEANTLAERARRALGEYAPIGQDKLYRSVRHGRHLELFLLDVRSYRGPNPDNADPNGLEMLGSTQTQWLKDALAASTATWKVIASTDPMSIVTGSEGDWDGWAQGDSAVQGREVQLADLLRFIKDQAIDNVVVLTADVHFAAAIDHDPQRATFRDFNRFWEFVSGPVHAGAFGPGPLDESFGPSYTFARGPATEGLPPNTPPPHLQSYGSIEVTDGGQLIARLHNIDGSILFEKKLRPK